MTLQEILGTVRKREFPNSAINQIPGVCGHCPVCGVLRRKCAKIPNRSEIINGFWNRLYVKSIYL
jgi:hypothetical protein